jgi:predicted  nucleic acid-binding Zn-ribbon protein
LDNLGISAKDLQEEFKKTGDFAGAVGNIITKEMGNSVTSIDEATSATQKLEATWANFKENLANNFAPIINDALDAVNKRLNILSTDAPVPFFDKLSFFLSNGINTAGIDALAIGLQNYRTELEVIQDTIGDLQSENEFILAIGQISEAMQKMRDNGKETTDIYKSLELLFKLLNVEFDKFIATSQQTTKFTETLKNLNEQLSILKTEFENTDINSPLFRTLQAEIKALEERIESIVNPTNKGSIAALEKEISKLSEEQKKLNTTTEASIKKYADLQTKINELQRKISELKRLGDPLEKFNIEAVGKDIEISNEQLKKLEYIMQGIADKTLTAADMLKRFDSEVKNLKKSTGVTSVVKRLLSIPKGTKSNRSVAVALVLIKQISGLAFDAV